MPCPKPPEVVHVSARVVEAFCAVQRRFYAGDDVASDLRAFLADDVAWHVPGRSAIAGEYRGVARVLAYFAARREIADETFRITPGGTLADVDRVVHFAGGQARVDGALRHWRTLGIFRIVDSLIAECRLLPFDQYEFDEIWAGREHERGPTVRPSEMELAGLEPATSWVRSRRSPS